jgi:hypothetical protein
MSSELSLNDYKNILKYYNIKIPTSKIQLKLKAESIMATKLCKCIKRIDPKNEQKSIAICTKTLFNNRGYNRGKFTCIGNKSIKITKKTKKTRKNRRLIK